MPYAGGRNGRREAGGTPPEPRTKRRAPVPKAEVWSQATRIPARPIAGRVRLPTKFDLAINLRTAQSLGVTMPPSVRGRAAEVIQ